MLELRLEGAGSPSGPSPKEVAPYERFDIEFSIALPLAARGLAVRGVGVDAGAGAGWLRRRRATLQQSAGDPADAADPGRVFECDIGRDDWVVEFILAETARDDRESGSGRFAAAQFG